MMMKTVVRAACGLVLAVFCFGAGAVVAGMRHWFQPLVHVTVQNDSGGDLESLVLEHRSGGNSGVVTLPALKRGKSAEAWFFIRGEGEYRILARLAGGRVLDSGADSYVESGYSAREVIGPLSITSHDISRFNY